MPNYKVIAILSLVALAACQPRSLPPVAPDGQAMPSGNQTNQAETEQIPLRVLQQINTLRGNVAAPPLTLNPQLSAAALAHSRDMSAQNRAWHWGSDGSSPLDRARKAGYFGTVMGENISESYEDEIQTLTAWMGVRDTRDVIMDPAATNLGFALYQEPSGKRWWTLLTGS
ncbi:CAP domain-containing protein [Paracoccus sediminis]|uniref:CAP domain-containing protein n=1 Tax=Paracoccus sediminis TaxID=1214787 RepID=A0A238VWJ2_9RHOB|nr:CAP domain-containing protein [Paracoccus sediminis]TBN51368.1 CAP domain-containing protein [Paracoccus sediminis]SNR38702.1 Uncharacterized conserved protein YkwD, contains CAP (CSP/antigen 5/PR1) domain [Paracoccus sediminis]